jgi:hypothetical protein
MNCLVKYTSFVKAQFFQAVSLFDLNRLASRCEFLQMKFTVVKLAVQVFKYQIPVRYLYKFALLRKYNHLRQKVLTNLCVL